MFFPSKQFTLYSTYTFDEIHEVLDKKLTQNIWTRQNNSYYGSPKFISHCSTTCFTVHCKQYSNSIICSTIGMRDTENPHLLHITQSFTLPLKIFTCISFALCSLVILFTLITSIALFNQGGLKMLFALILPTLFLLLFKTISKIGRAHV